jgi:hypothetical protein
VKSTYWTCPRCGNTDRLTIEDNGLSYKSPDYTLRCAARVEPKESASYDTSLSVVDEDGKTQCDERWCPNAEVTKYWRTWTVARLRQRCESSSGRPT